uniref:Uncharacterized protein n=1 Tax=Oryzias sinensis TaxID=183150 RepID=A0A8C7XGX6_9TELE
VFAIQPVCLVIRDEELRSVRVWSRVGHGEMLTWSRVFEDEVFIVKLSPVDGLPASAVVVGEVAPLTHELRYNAMEAASLVQQWPLSWLSTVEMVLLQENYCERTFFPLAAPSAHSLNWTCGFIP